MIITFNDGTTYEVSDHSTKTDILIFVENYSSVDEVATIFTTDHLQGALFGDERITTLCVDGLSAKSIDSGVEVHVTCHEKTELELLKEKQVETDNALLELAEMIMGGLE